MKRDASAPPAARSARRLLGETDRSARAAARGPGRRFTAPETALARELLNASRRSDLALLTSEGAIDGDRNEAARGYRHSRRWGRRLVARRARAAEGDAGGWLAQCQFPPGRT